MTMWNPHIDNRIGPRYLAIVEALAQDVAKGRLLPGTRLPTHRDLASRLGVTVGTISRAYAEAERRGLTQGEVGRGTFVSDHGMNSASTRFSPQTAEVIDLSTVCPVKDLHGQTVAVTLATLAARPDLAPLLTYSPGGGLPAHRAAGAEWLRRRGLEARKEQIVITSGAQHGLATVIAALTEPGDLLLTEALTYSGIIAIASQLHRRRLQGLEMDEYGIRPDAFESVCRCGPVGALVCVPTLQNPSTATMTEDRRREIAEIAREYNVKIIDDDVYGLLVEDGPPPLYSFAPERSCYVTSISKSLAPGLRVGYVLAPENMIAKIAASVRTSVWMPAPLMAEIASMWIMDGTADRQVQWQREEAHARQELATRILGQWDIRTHPHSFHLWLQLPEPWRANEFTQQARARGVAVVPADVFAVGRTRAPHAVRICLTAAAGRTELEKGLSILADILRASADPRVAVI